MLHSSMDAKTVGIVGAGISGLAACKYAVQKGFLPIVFEADSGIGGVWSRTLRTTKLQTPRPLYQFVDFPWPEDVKESFPSSKKVMAYLDAYVRQFDLRRYIRFGSHVAGVEYVGVSEEEMESWALWSGNGEAFGEGGKGKWQLTVQHMSGGEESAPRSEIYEVDFLVLRIGMFSGLPNIPSFPTNKGPEVFNGKVLHSMDYSNMDNSAAVELIKGKRTVVVGFSKSAVDIAAECSDANGAKYPCMLLYRETKWVIPADLAWGHPIALLYLTRLAELLIHKPGEGPLLSLLATSLSPLYWLLNKSLESYCKWKMPLTKYGLQPNHSLTQELISSTVILHPERFYDRMEEGSIVPIKSQSFSFYENGIITDDGKYVPADVVIFATGFKGDEKIRNIFKSPKLQKIIIESTPIPLYRECIHPRIPQLGIIGYCESVSNLFMSEMRCLWLMHFLAGSFRLPVIKSMKEEVFRSQEFMRKYCRSKSSVGNLQLWHNDRLCKDIGCDPPARKKGLLDWFIPYMPEDYKELGAR